MKVRKRRYNLYAVKEEGDPILIGENLEPKLLNYSIKNSKFNKFIVEKTCVTVEYVEVK